MCLFAIIKSYLFADRLRCIIGTIAQACRAEFNRPTPSAILYDNVGKLRNGNHLFEIETSLEITDRERFRFFYFFTWIKITVNTYKQFLNSWNAVTRSIPNTTIFILVFISGQHLFIFLLMIFFATIPRKSRSVVNIINSSDIRKDYINRMSALL